jgi:nucleoside-triphosphatase THEP1
MQTIVGSIKSLQHNIITVEKKDGTTLSLYSEYTNSYSRKGDIIVATYNSNNQLTRPPLIQPLARGDAFKSLLFRQTKQAAQIYENLLKAFEEKELIRDVTELSYKQWRDMPVDVGHLTQDNFDEKAIRIFLSRWYEEMSMRRLYLLGFTTKEIRAAHMQPDAIYEQCLLNPYKVLSLSLAKCQHILSILGKTVSLEEKRVGEIARLVYNNLKSNCHVATPLTRIGRSFPDYKSYLPVLKKDYNIVEDVSCLYLAKVLDIELGMVTILRHLQTIPHKRICDIVTTGCSTCSPVELTDEQKDAVLYALNNGVSIITGGAGTGKTTVIAQIVHNLQLHKRDYLLCSFTGKAVSRLREVTQKPAYTVHSLIHNSSLTSNTKEYHVIVDECSMVRTPLLHKLLTKIKATKLTLVGDRNQLHPIGWGAFMDELLKSRAVPVATLTRNHRNTDGIMLNCTSILERRSLEPYNNFKLIPGNDEIVESILVELKERGVKKDQIRIITPYKVNIPNLNTLFQELYREGQTTRIAFGDSTWYVGDTVLFNKNNNALQVFNGDEGKVTTVDSSCMYVSHPRHASLQITNGRRHNDDDEADVDTYSINDITLSYTITVDKSQGSEYDYLIFYLPLSAEASCFLNVNRLYTAISRAKMYCWCVGNIACMNIAIQQNPPHRNDNLHTRLKRG